MGNFTYLMGILYLYLRMCLLLPPLITRYLIDLKVLFKVDQKSY